MKLSNIVASTIEKQAITLQVSLMYRLQSRAVVALYGEWQENYDSFYESEVIQHVKQQVYICQNSYDWVNRKHKWDLKTVNLFCTLEFRRFSLR